MTFSSMRLHPAVQDALHKRGFHEPTPFQQRLLHRTIDDYADTVVEAEDREGRATGLAIFAAHCALNSSAPSNRCVVILCATDRLQHISEAIQNLGISGITVQCCFSCKGNQPKIGGGADIYAAPIDVLQNTATADCESIVSILADDVSKLEPTPVLRFFRKLIQASPAVNLCLCSSEPPSRVDCSIRSMLRRTNRRLCFKSPTKPNYVFLLCQDQFDRADLNARVSQLSGLGRVLILTHNKEVRDLKSHLHQEFALRTYSIQRTTSASDRERVLSDFLNCKQAVLVAMDAFIGVDLIDIDALIQYYPPQKSMPDDEWREFAHLLNSTNDPDRPTLVCTLVGIDDLALCSHFQQRVGVHEPIMNVSPFHKRFADIVRFPRAVAAEKMLAGGVPSGPFAAALTDYHEKERGPENRSSRKKNAEDPTIPLPRSKQD